MAQNNEHLNSYSGLAERHHRRPAGTAVITGARTAASRRRGLPETYAVEQEEQDYQARYEQQMNERRQQRAAERREARKREISSTAGKKKVRNPQMDEKIIRWFKIIVAAVLCIVLLVCSVLAYEKVSGSHLFVVKEIDVQGTVHSNRAEMVRMLSAYQGRSLWQLDLQGILAAIEKDAWVAEAEVTRVLPDALRVTIQEREPIAVWHTPSGAVVWVDLEGRKLGELDLNKNSQIPPIVTGLEEGNTPEIRAANRQRLVTYQKLIAELDQTTPKITPEIDRVEIEADDSIHVRLTKHNVGVKLGNKDFRIRLEKAQEFLTLIDQKEISSLGFLSHFDAARIVQGERIAYLNMMHPERVVVGFDK